MVEDEDDGVDGDADGDDDDGGDDDDEEVEVDDEGELEGGAALDEEPVFPAGAGVDGIVGIDEAAPAEGEPLAAEPEEPPPHDAQSRAASMAMIKRIAHLPMILLAANYSSLYGSA